MHLLSCKRLDKKPHLHSSIKRGHFGGTVTTRLWITCCHLHHRHVLCTVSHTSTSVTGEERSPAWQLMVTLWCYLTNTGLRMMMSAHTPSTAVTGVLLRSGDHIVIKSVFSCYIRLNYCFTSVQNTADAHSLSWVTHPIYRPSCAQYSNLMLWQLIYLSSSTARYYELRLYCHTTGHNVLVIWFQLS